jgi:hypothetical protein
MSTVVHVGYQKTATTALQRNVFPQVPGCVYLNVRSEFEPFTHSVERDDDGVYDEERWRTLLDSIRCPGQTLLISREDFTKATIRQRTAERLHALMPAARILFCVRSQATIIPSLYSQHLKGGGYVSFEQWLERPRLPGWLEWDRIVRLYQGLFGVEAVKVMAYEHLQNDLQGFVKEACSFIMPGTPAPPAPELPRVNRGLSPPSRWVFRQANRLFRRSDKNPSPTLASEPAWHAVESLMYRVDPVVFARMRRDGSRHDRELVERVVPRFEQSNARLAELTDLPLARYGYPLPSVR